MSAFMCGCDPECKPIPWICNAHREAERAVIDALPEPLGDRAIERARRIASRDKVPGVNPVTVVHDDTSCTNEEMLRRILKTRTEHATILQQYHDVWYNAPHTWHYLHFLGVGMMKCPNDLWMYQELLSTYRPKIVIETGTYAGGSALWFAMLMDMLAIEGGHVYSIDFEDHRQVQSHPRITFLAGDSTDPAVRDAIVDDIADGLDGQPLLVSLDADHSAEHVRKELELYAPLCKVGDWLIVEDTNISWGQEHLWRQATDETTRLRRWSCSCGKSSQVIGLDEKPMPCPYDDGKGSERGARGGIEDYCKAHPGEFRQDVLCERWLLTMHPGGWLRRIASCEHGT